MQEIATIYGTIKDGKISEVEVVCTPDIPREYTIVTMMLATARVMAKNEGYTDAQFDFMCKYIWEKSL